THPLQVPPPSKIVDVNDAARLNVPPAVMVRGTWIEWESVPLVPVTVNDGVPVAAVMAAVTLNVTDPLPLVTALPDGAALIPAGNPPPAKVIGMFPEPPVCVTLTVMLPELFWASEREFATLKLKSAAATVVNDTV